MGHWSDQLVDEAAAKVRGDTDRDKLRVMLNKAATEIELLSGRAFGITKQGSVNIDSGGLPFIDVPDLQVDAIKRDMEAWPVADPVNSNIATVLQLARPDCIPDRAIPIGKALSRAGYLIAQASRAGRFSRDFLLFRLGSFDSNQRIEFLKRLADPTERVNVPIVAAQSGGWWFQLTRRLL